MSGWGFVAGLVVGALCGPVAWLGFLVGFSALRHGSWTTLDRACDCPKDGRVIRPGQVHSLPADGLVPLRRCSVCGSRWARSYLRRVPGAPAILARVWAPPPGYTDDEIEARWSAYEAAHRG